MISFHGQVYLRGWRVSREKYGAWCVNIHNQIWKLIEWIYEEWLLERVSTD